MMDLLVPLSAAHQVPTCNDHRPVHAHDAVNENAALPSLHLLLRRNYPVEECTTLIQVPL